mmetsp:Transcript_12099/g.16895  ORF Transcript_12099/g.16895 Transcript_12099/m.16895 type:complete len:108 (+) Transcript_12099:239-562(+)
MEQAQRSNHDSAVETMLFRQLLQLGRTPHLSSDVEHDLKLSLTIAGHERHTIQEREDHDQHEDDTGKRGYRELEITICPGVCHLPPVNSEEQCNSISNFGLLLLLSD